MNKIAEIRESLSEVVEIVVDALCDGIGELEKENKRLREALEKVKFYNSDTVTNDRRIRHIIGKIVDGALKGELE